jgi:lipid II:glycine glycyltransferase (peptidoglycan interpeptide bridge formation enzyme)
MQDTTIKEIKDRDTWETFLQDTAPSTLLQSWDWGQFQKSLKRKVWYLGIYEGDDLTATCLCHMIPTKLRTHLYTSNGPVCEWETAEGAIKSLLTYLTELGKENCAKFIRMDPLISDTENNRALLANLGLQPAATNTQAENRWILDITPDEEALLNDMRKNTRYAIRRARKEGVTVESSTDPEELSKFWKLMQKTVEDQNFVPHAKSYYEKQLASFSKEGDYRIYWSHLDGEILAAALIPFYGESAYYLHASSDDKIKNTFPAHALIWQAILDAKQAGLTYFDFWGIAPTDDPDHPWAGFTFFKTGFGGFRQDVIRAHDKPLDFSYSLVRMLESTRRTWGKAYYDILQRKK